MFSLSFKAFVHSFGCSTTLKRAAGSNSPKLNLNKEEAKVVVGVLVKPLNRLTVLVTRMGDNPDYDLGALAGSIGNHLAKVVVIRFLELILDDYLTSGAGFLCVDVHVK